MPKGKRWDRYERLTACRAWCACADMEHICDLDGKAKEVQDHGTFLRAYFDHFKSLAPKEHESGMYEDRGTNSAWSYLRDEIFKDTRNFSNGPLKLVMDEYIAKRHPFLNKENPSLQQVIVNIAVAIHLGKADVVKEEHVDFPAEEWTNYLGWKELYRSPWFCTICETTRAEFVKVKGEIYDASEYKAPVLRDRHDSIVSGNRGRKKRKRAREIKENPSRSDKKPTMKRTGIIQDPPIVFQISTVVDQIRYVADRFKSFAPDLKTLLEQNPEAANEFYPVVNEILPVVNQLFPMLNEIHTSVEILKDSSTASDKASFNNPF